MNPFTLHPSPFTLRWAWVALLLFAYALRLHHLDFESFWIDEATSLYLVRRLFQDLSLLLRPDENAATFWLILGLWVQGAGTSDYALRYASLLFAVPIVPLMYVVGARLVGHPAAWAASVLAAGSSFLIYYAQEARTYSFLALLSLLGLYLLLRGLARPRARGWWAGYALAAMVMLVTHVFGAVAVACQVVYVAGRLHRRLGRRGWRLLAGLAAVLLPLLLWRAALAPLVPRWRASMDLLLPELAQQTTADLLSWLAFPTDPVAALSWPLPYVVLLAGVAGMARAGTTASHALWMATTLIALPLIARNVLLAQVALLSAHRYLIFAAPVFLVVVAAGVAWIGRRWPAAGGAVVTMLLLVSLFPWWRIHVDGQRTKEDWRATVQAVETTLQEGDIGLFPEWQTRAAYAHYSRKALTTIALEGMPMPPTQAYFESILGPHLNSGRQLVAVSLLPLLTLPAELEDWLGARALKVEEHNAPGLAFLRYRLESFPRRDPPPVQHPRPASFAGNISLLGFDLLPAAGATGPLGIALHWQARGPIAHPVLATLLLEDADGETWAASHEPPTHDFYPVTTWQPGQILRDERKLALLPGTPAGSYTLRLGLRRADTQEVLPLLGPDGSPTGALATLGPVTLNPSWRDARPPTGALSLEGRTASGPRLEAVTLPDSARRPGQAMPLTTFWRLEGPFAELRLTIELRASDGRVFVSPTTATLRAPADAAAGQLLAHRSAFRLPAELSPGSTTVALRLSDPRGQPLLFHRGSFTAAQPSLPLGSLEVLSGPAPATIPRNATKLDQPWRDSISLAAFTMDPARALPAGGSLSVTLYWAAARTPEKSYTVFVHLLDAGGRLVAQRDGQPGEGAAPTTGWLPGQTVADPHRLTLPANIEPGTYSLIIGLYEPSSGKRLARPGGAEIHTLGQIEVR